MDVAIFGAGIAGLMTAITMRAQGHHCRVYERHRKSHEAGMGFILVPAAVECLEEYGVHLEGPFSGTFLRKYICRDSKGKILAEKEIPAGARAIRRRDLMAALVRSLSPETPLTFDAELEAVEFNSRGLITAARLSSGARVHADLYVAADGVYSRGRNALFPDWPAPADRVPEVVGMVRCRGTVRWAAHDFNKFHAADGGLAFGVLPVDNDHLVWFIQADALRFPPPSENAEACKVFVKKLLRNWAEPVPHLLSITDFSRVHLWHAVDADLVPRFHKGNLVLVGDAAHPLLPFTSQGVSSAVADAVALAHLTGVYRNLGKALAQYSLQRREQCAPYVSRGRELMQNFLAPLHTKGVVLPMA